jgi:adenylate cyclase class IV
MKNLEVKAYCSNTSVFEQFEKYYKGELVQTDTYYKCTNGRLKLREEKSFDFFGSPPKLIHYERSNEAVERVSNFDFYPIEDLNFFKKIFSGALTVEVTVNKTRKIVSLQTCSYSS